MSNPNLESDQARATASNQYPEYDENHIRCPRCSSSDVYATPLGEFESCVDCGHVKEVVE